MICQYHCMPRASRERTRTGRRRASAEATEGPRMQTTTIALDEDTHWRLRQLALDQRTSFRKLIRTAIADISGATREGASHARPATPLPARRRVVDRLLSPRPRDSGVREDDERAEGGAAVA